MSKRAWRIMAVWIAGVAALCFLFAVVGLGWLYFKGYSSHAFVPQPVLVAMLLTPLYGILAGFCFLASLPNPPGGGQRRHLFSFLKNIVSTFAV